MKIIVFDTELNDREIKTLRQSCVLSITQISNLLKASDADPLGTLKYQRRHYFDLLSYMDGDPASPSLGDLSKHTIKKLKDFSEPEIFIDDKILYPGYASVIRMAFSGGVHINSKAYKYISSLIHEGLK